jgi:hypothetical protein
MGGNKWDRIHNVSSLGDIHEKIKAGTAADKVCEQLEAATGLKVLSERIVRGLPACPMQDAMREASRIVLKDFELRTDTTVVRYPTPTYLNAEP